MHRFRTASSHHLSHLNSQGSNATGDCCSKCFNDLQKSAAPPVAAPQPPAPVAQPAAEPEPVVEAPQPVVAAPPAAQPIKKEKKKGGYKNMLAGMMEGSGTRDIEKEKEKIASVTGGGQFSKIDKI